MLFFSVFSLCSVFKKMPRTNCVLFHSVALHLAFLKRDNTFCVNFVKKCLDSQSFVKKE